MKIEYKYQGSYKNVPMYVFMEGKKLGVIKSVGRKYAYFPKGINKFMGQPFDTIEQVQQSLSQE